MANNNFSTGNTLREILAELAKPVPENLISSKSTYQKGKASGSARYIAWPALIRLLDVRTGGFWEWKIRTIYAGDRFVVEGSLTIYGNDGSLTREATGTELSDVDSYGDPTSNAEAMALRRCCAKFGVGLDLWEKSANKSANNSVIPVSTKPANNGLTREEWQAKFGGAS